MKIAIVGTGITGLAAAWLLHPHHDITVYEQNDVTGGHSNTVHVPPFAPVDTGFIVFNELTYPNLFALFDHIGVAYEKTEMGFGVSLDNGRLEYSAENIFAQKRNFLRLRFYRMLIDIVRFYKDAPKLLNLPRTSMSLSEYLTEKKYSDAFIQDHLLPMAAAIWSMSAEQMKNFPAQSFVRFFVNHGLLRLTKRPQWYTVTYGSRQYIDKMTEKFRDRIHTHCPVISVKRDDSGVILTSPQGSQTFDHVIFACHSDQSLKILGHDASDDEKKILGFFPYSENIAYLHRDPNLMPKRKAAWTSWNYLASTSDGKVSLTYWMNMLQKFLPQNEDLFVTLNPPSPPREDLTLKKIIYHHPQYTQNALDGWASIKNIQGKNRTWFCGAWCGYGFHEDGLSAGLAVAERVGGVKRPWDIIEKSPAGQHAVG